MAKRRAVAVVTMLRRYDAGEYLFLQDMPADGFYVIIKGQVRVHRIGNDGREQILHLFGPGELCGEVPVFKGRNYPAGAVAARPTQALYVPAADFRHVGNEHPEVYVEMLAVLSFRLREFVALIDDLSLKEVSARLAKHLLDLHVRSGNPTVELDMTKAVLAAKLGTIAETLSRTLKKMQQRRIIEVDGRAIAILDATALARIAAGEKL